MHSQMDGQTHRERQRQRIESPAAPTIWPNYFTFVLLFTHLMSFFLPWSSSLSLALLKFCAHGPAERLPSFSSSPTSHSFKFHESIFESCVDNHRFTSCLVNRWKEAIDWPLRPALFFMRSLVATEATLKGERERENVNRFVSPLLSFFQFSSFSLSLSLSPSPAIDAHYNWTTRFVSTMQYAQRRVPPALIIWLILDVAFL